MAADGLLKGACTLRQEDLLYDFIIEVENERFKVHKVIMACVSNYFKVMLTGWLAESQSDRVRLHELNPLVVSNMIDFVYTGQLDTTDVNTEDLLACAVYLQIPTAIDECTKLLINKVNKENCFDILAIFKTYSVKVGIEKVAQYIANTDDLMQISPLNMSSDGFQCFMEYWQKSEWELFRCVLDWINVHENRRLHLNDLLRHVRFALMTQQQLTAVKQTEVYTGSDGAWQELVTAAEVFHNLPTRLKVLEESDQSKVRQDPVPICYTADEALSSVFYSLYDGESWTKHQAQLAPSLCEGIAAHIVVNNYLIVCDSYIDDRNRETFIQGWHIFDPRTLIWSTMAPMNVARDDFAVVHYKKHLYALGGCTESDQHVTDAIERYTFETDTWETLPIKLPVPQENHGACVIGDSIYVGYSDSYQRLDCLHLSTNTWESKAPPPNIEGMCTHVDEIQVMKLWDEEVLFIFDYTFVMHYYSPAKDKWSKLDCLSHMDSVYVHNFCPYVIPDRDTLFLHSFSCNFKQNVRDNSYYQGRRRRLAAAPGECIGCVQWTVGEKGEKITEVRLDDFPVDKYGENECQVFTALLAMPPQYLRRPKNISVGLPHE